MAFSFFTPSLPVSRAFSRSLILSDFRLPADAKIFFSFHLQGRGFFS